MAFDGTFMLNKDAFVYEKYNFSIAKVVDARFNKQKPTGFYYEGLLNKIQTVGNDTISSELERFFLKHHKSFYEPTKIILVINQINLIEILNGNTDDFEITLAFDYYRITENMAKLEYSQYLKFDKSAGLNKASGLNKIFSEAMAAAFLQFKNQIMYYKPLEFTAQQTEDLVKRLNSLPVKRIESANGNDGLYFNIGQLIRNAPVLTSNYKIINDSALINFQPVLIDCKSYLVKKAFAFIKNNQLYIYISDGKYLPAVVEADGRIFLKEIYYKKKENIFNNKTLANLRAFSPLLRTIKIIKDVTADSDQLKIQVDEETGQLKF